MKKYLLFIVCSLLMIPAAFAQDLNGKDRAKMREEMQKFKIDFLAQKMELSEKQKAEFTPIYNEFDEQRRKAGSEAWKFERELKKKKDASDADYKKLSELQQKAREKDAELCKNLDSRLESVLTAKQIYTLHQAEGMFFDKMKEMHKKHNPSKKKTSESKKKKKNHRKNHPSESMPELAVL